MSEGINLEACKQEHEFAVKKDYTGKCVLVNHRIMPWEINAEGSGGALVLRYWECSLRCALCYSQAYAYLNTGGSRVKYGLFLGECSEENLIGFVSMLQEALPNLAKGRLAIEISFKGANPAAAQEYAVSMPIEIKVLETQILGFFRLLKVVSENVWGKGENRIAVYPVAGIGPQLSNPTFVPVDPNTPNLPLFHPHTWSKEFAEVTDKFRQTLAENPSVYLKYVRAHGNLIPIESMEPSYFQFGWTSQISKRLELRNYVKKHMRISGRSRLSLYGQAISEIPDADSQLPQRVTELKPHFYEAEPSSHYPYL